MIGFYYTTTLLLISLSLSHRHLCRAKKITSAANTLQNDTNHDDEVISILSLSFSLLFLIVFTLLSFLFDFKTLKTNKTLTLTKKEKGREKREK